MRGGSGRTGRPAAACVVPHAAQVSLMPVSLPVTSSDKVTAPAGSFPSRLPVTASAVRTSADAQAAGTQARAPLPHVHLPAPCPHAD